MSEGCGTFGGCKQLEAGGEGDGAVGAYPQPVEVEPGALQGQGLLHGDHHLGVAPPAVHRPEQGQHHGVRRTPAECERLVIHVLQAEQAWMGCSRHFLADVGRDLGQEELLEILLRIARTFLLPFLEWQGCRLKTSQGEKPSQPPRPLKRCCWIPAGSEAIWSHCKN